MKGPAHRLPLLALFAGLALAAAAGGARADGPLGVITGRVLVVDGDTITVGGRPVRLWAIDAADLNQECVPRKMLTCGEYARIALQQLATGRIARCEVKENPTFAAHVVARCEITEEGLTVDMAREMVRLGYAYAQPAEGRRPYASLELRIMPFKRPSEWRELRAEENERRR